jgi:LPXTG-motif cell wall-anchored protein
MRRMMKRALVAVALLGACLGFGTQVAHAGDAAPQLRLPSFIEAGAVGSLTVTGFNSFGCPPDEKIQVFVTPKAGGTTTLLVEIPSSQIVAGQATVQFTAPASPGDFSANAERDDGDDFCQAVSTLEVTAPTTSSTSTTTTTTTTAPTNTAAPTTTAGPTTSAAAIVPPTTAAQLPATGGSSSSTSWMAIAALMFLAMGSALLAVRRRPG